MLVQASASAIEHGDVGPLRGGGEERRTKTDKAYDSEVRSQWLKWSGIVNGILHTLCEHKLSNVPRS